MGAGTLSTKPRETKEKTDKRDFWMYEKKRVHKMITRVELGWVSNTDTLVPNIDSSGPSLTEKDIGRRSKSRVLQICQGNKEEKNKNTMILWYSACLFYLIPPTNVARMLVLYSLSFPDVSHQALQQVYTQRCLHSLARFLRPSSFLS